MSRVIKFSTKTHSQSFSLNVRPPSWQAAIPNFLFQESSLRIRSQFHALSVMCAPYSFQYWPHQTLWQSFQAWGKVILHPKRAQLFQLHRPELGLALALGRDDLIKTPLYSHIQKGGFQRTLLAPCSTQSQSVFEEAVTPNYRGKSGQGARMPVLVPLLTIKYLPKHLWQVPQKETEFSACLSFSVSHLWQPVSLLLWCRSEVQPTASQRGRVLQQQPPWEQLHGDHPNHPASGFSPWTGAQPEPIEHRH